jgi:RNase P subunit RPR2
LAHLIVKGTFRRMNDSTGLHPAITRVLCPECGSLMRLERVDPEIDARRDAETTTFSCVCGFTYRHTLDR